MSFCCGQCTQPVVQRYRMLFRLERDEGKVGYPKKGRRLPNAIICIDCLERVAEGDQHHRETSKALFEARPGSIYIMSEADLSDFYYISPSLVEGLFPQALHSIDLMTWNLAQMRKAG